MSKSEPKKGKGGKRKIGRSFKKPAHNRYTSERRWETNKAKRAAKIKKALEKKAVKKARKNTQQFAPEHLKSWDTPLNG